MLLKIFFSLFFAYLLGSVSFAYLIAKVVKKVDIRKIGSKNPGAATSGGTILYLVPKLFPLVLILYFFVQKKGPRSAPLLLLAVVIFFVFLVFLYPHRYQWLVPSILFLMGIGAIANVSAIREMRK